MTWFEQTWLTSSHTCCILVVLFTTTLSACMTGPAMVDMAFILHTPLADITYGVVFTNVGFFAGSSLGFLHYYIDREITLTLLTTLCGLFTCFTPLSDDLCLYYAIMFVTGMGAGIWDASYRVWICDMWRRHSAPVLHVCAVTASVGSVFGPLLVKPYLTGDLKRANTTDGDINDSIDRRARLQAPYMWGGCLILTAPAMLIVIDILVKFYSKKREPIDDCKSTVQTSGAHGDEQRMYSTRRRTLIILLALNFMAYMAFENLYLTYLSVYYQYLPIGLSAPKTAEVLSAVFATSALGRAVSAVMSSTIRTETMIGIHLAFVFLSLFVIHFGNHSMAYIWIGNVMIGYGMSSLTVSYYELADNYTKLTTKTNTVFSLLSMLSSIMANLVIGTTIETKPELFIAIEFALLITTIVLFRIILRYVKHMANGIEISNLILNEKGHMVYTVETTVP